MKVTRLPKDPGPAGWNALLPEAAPPRVLDTHQTADWLVIGAGFAGLAAAHRLSQLDAQARITVLDASRVGAGPAGRNSGFMIDLPHDLSSDAYTGGLEHDLAQTADNRRGIEFAAQMARSFHMSREAFNRSGKINAAATKKGMAQNAAFAAHLRAMGEDHSLLDASEMGDITGTDYYAGGLFTPGAAIIQPAMFVRAAAQGMQSNRVQIFENSPVVELARAGASWVARTPQGQITAPGVILAVNGHLESFGYKAGRLMHVFTYASMTRPLTGAECKRLGGRSTWAVTPADPSGTTVRRISGQGGDRIVIRNRFTYEPSMEVSDARVAASGKWHDRAFAARFPMLKGVEMAYRWGGRLCLSYNNVQVVEELEHGLWAACCQNGLGTVKGTLAGVVAAEAACGLASEALSRFRAAPAPKRLPPAPVARVGAYAKLRWSAWRAGGEL